MASVVKEGWLQKRGEYVKDWRPGWFVLKTDGTILGFKDKPVPGDEAEPSYNFKINRYITILPRENIKKNAFLLRWSLPSSIVELLFCPETASDGREWMAAFTKVSEDLQ